MNKSVNPLLALAIVIVFGSLLAFKFHFYGKALAVPAVNTLKISPSGTLYLKVGTDLFEYSEDGIFKQKFDLKQLGITEDRGDFDFFSNGDLLINRDKLLPTIKDKLKSYARITNTDQKVAELGKGLQRCKLRTSECFSFNQEIPALQGNHYIHIDRSNDDVYLADTIRHAVRKLDESGELLAEIKTGLKFPNQVYFEDEKLWVVDTNHHVMKAIDASNDNFGDVIEQHETTHKTMDEGSWIWPSAFSQVGTGWWVNVSNDAMENAQVVMFDNYWEKKGTLSLPKNADPIASVKVNNSVIIADYNQYALYRFDLAGVRGPDFAHDETSDGIKSVLEKNKAENQKYILWSDLCLWVGISLFVLIFAYAVLKALKDKKEKQGAEENKGEYNKDEITKQHILDLAKLPIEGEWIEAKPIMKYVKWYLVALAILMVFSIVSLHLLMKDKLPIELLATFIIMPASIALSMIPIERISRYKIGFFKNKVTIETHKGKHISAFYKDIKWNDRAFIINEWFIPIGNKSQGVFPYQKLVDRLMPYVSSENKLGPLDLFKLQWHSPEGSLKFVSMTIVGMLILLAILKRSEIQTFFSSFI